MEQLIRVVDLETTGFTPPEAAVCEVAFVDLTSSVVGDGSWLVGEIFSLLCDPGHPIPPETSAIHHIIDEDVVELLPFSDVDDVLTDVPAGTSGITAFAAHSAKMERQWITDEMTGGIPWICTYKCALRIWPTAPSHSNQALRYLLKPEGLDRSVANVAHRAGPDAYVTAFLLRELLKHASIEQLIEWSGQPALQYRCQIGTWRGRPWHEVDSGFLRWVEGKDFDEDVLFTVKTELERRHAEWEAQRRRDAAEQAAASPEPATRDVIDQELPI